MAFKKRKLLPPGIILFCITVVVLLSIFKPEPQQRSQERPAVLVNVLSAEKQDVRFQISSQGTVEPRHQTNLVAEVSGRVVALADDFVAGGFFEAGEMMLQIDPSDYRVMVQEARANLAQAQAALEEELARAQVAKEEWASIEAGKIPPLGLREPQVASAVANVDSAKARLAKAERDLDRTTIRAPFAGLLRNRNVDLGQYVGTGTAIGMLLGTDVAEVRLPMSDRDLAYLDLPRHGEELSAELDVRLTSNVAGETITWLGKLVRSEGVLDEASRVIYAVIEVQDPYNLAGQRHPQPLRFGRFVQAQVAGMQADDMVVVPRYAVTARNTVWLVNENRELEEREITIRRTDGNDVYVSAGLQDGDKVLLTQLANPLPSMRVRLESDPVPSSMETAIAAKSTADEQVSANND